MIQPTPIKRSYLERSILSEHELRLFCTALEMTGWWTCHEITERSTLKRRIVHQHLTRWLKLGLLERIKLSPDHRWRVAPAASDQPHYTRLAETAKRLGWLEEK